MSAITTQGWGGDALVTSFGWGGVAVGIERPDAYEYEPEITNTLNMRPFLVDTWKLPLPALDTLELRPGLDKTQLGEKPIIITTLDIKPEVAETTDELKPIIKTSAELKPTLSTGELRPSLSGSSTEIRPIVEKSSIIEPQITDTEEDEE